MNPVTLLKLAINIPIPTTIAPIPVLINANLNSFIPVVAAPVTKVKAACPAAANLVPIDSSL